MFLLGTFGTLSLGRDKNQSSPGSEAEFRYNIRAGVVLVGIVELLSVILR